MGSITIKTECRLTSSWHVAATIVSDNGSERTIVFPKAYPSERYAIQGALMEINLDRGLEPEVVIHYRDDQTAREARMISTYYKYWYGHINFVFTPAAE